MVIQPEFDDPEYALPLHQRLYNRTVRPVALRVFGPQIASFGGVAVRTKCVLDSQHYIDYKPAMAQSIDEYVAEGDHVIDIAAGRGVFAVRAARQGATVTSYEAAENMVRLARDTIRLNETSDSVEVVHALIGEGFELYGDTGDGTTISPEELPEADVLLLDCEGAEVSILEDAQSAARVIVETHPRFDAPADKVRAILDSRGYEVVSDEPMDRPQKQAIVAELD